MFEWLFSRIQNSIEKARLGKGKKAIIDSIGVPPPPPPTTNPVPAAATPPRLLETKRGKVRRSLRVVINPRKGSLRRMPRVSPARAPDRTGNKRVITRPAIRAAGGTRLRRNLCVTSMPEPEI